MSDLPGEITKQILSAPPAIIRSTRYSETAHGRSTPSSVRLPTGSNSLEHANGWIRLPRPAAGMTPHISRLLSNESAWPKARNAIEHSNQFNRPPARAMLVEYTLAGAARHRQQLAVFGLEGSDHVRCTFSRNDFAAGLEECIEPVPDIADNRSTTGCGLEQPARWTPAHLGHRAPGDIQRQPGRTEERRMLGR